MAAPMRAALALLFMLSAGSPALACHHYRSWSYPWPQSCKLTSARPHRTWIAQAPVPDIDPIIIPPGWDEEQERAEALRQAERKLEENK
jgi:hypothetical protein